MIRAPRVAVFLLLWWSPSLFAQRIEERDVPNAMGIHTPFIIAAVGSFLAWVISYALEQHRERQARSKSREALLFRKERLLDEIAVVEADHERGALQEAEYAGQMRKLKSQLSRVLEKLATPTLANE